MKTKDQRLAEAVKAALAGGRTFGQAQHKIVVRNLIAPLRDAEMEDADYVAVIDALVEIANISAFQQRLEKAGLIDRAKKVGNDVLMKLLAGE